MPGTRRLNVELALRRRFYLISATTSKMSKALSLLDREIVAYNTKENWIDVRTASAARALELLNSSGIEAEITPRPEDAFQELLAQLVNDLEAVLQELDPTEAPSFASVILKRITAVENRLKRIEKKL